MRKNIFESEAKTPAQVLQQARQAQAKKQYRQAANFYLECAKKHETDLQKIADHILHAAQCFERQHDTQESVKYYLKAADFYSESYCLQHSLSALKACFRLNHDKTFIYPILCQLRSQDLWHPDMLELLPEQEAIFQRIMRANDVDDTFFNTVKTYEAFETLMEHMDVVHAEQGDVLAKNEANADAVYFIVTGKVEALIPHPTRVDSMGYITDMEMFGEAEFFLEHKWIAQIEACSDCTFLRLPYKNIDTLKRLLPNLKPSMAMSYCHRILLRRLTVAPIFSELDQHVRTEISREISLVHLKTGDCLFREGDSAIHVYIVISGNLRMYLSVEGREVAIKEFGASSTFGEIALVNQGVRTATAVATEESCLLRIHGTIFRETYEDSQELRWLLRVRKDFQLKEVQHFIQEHSTKAVTA